MGTLTGRQIRGILSNQSILLFGGITWRSGKKRSGAVAPFYSVAITWVVYALAFDLYTVWNFLFLILLSGGVFLLVRALCGDKADTPVQAAREEEKKEEDEPTGNEELDKMIRDGRLAIAEMKRLDDNIPDEKLSAQIRRLEEVSGQIFQQVKADPQKLPQIRKFMDYYLPTTLKLLNAYDRMSGTGVSGENIDSTLERVEKMMGTHRHLPLKSSWTAFLAVRRWISPRISPCWRP